MLARGQGGARRRHARGQQAAAPNRLSHRRRRSATRARCSPKSQQHLGRSRLFTVGIGSAPNDYFMAGAARAGRGTYTFISAPEQVEERMGVLFKKLERPVMTDLAAAWPAERRRKLGPIRCPISMPASPCSSRQRRRTRADRSRSTGNLAGKPWRAVLDLDDAETGKGIAKVWARNKISALEEQRAARTATWSAIDASVLKVALDYHLVSRLTSLVAVDITPSRPTGTPHRQRQAAAQSARRLGLRQSLRRAACPACAPRTMSAPAALAKLAMRERAEERWWHRKMRVSICPRARPTCGCC